jgi:acyl carrier protein
MKEELRNFLKVELIMDPTYPLEDDEPLFSGGLIDSFSLVQVAVFVEENYGVHLEDTDLTVENMDTLGQMVAYIEAKDQ